MLALPRPYSADVVLPTVNSMYNRQLACCAFAQGWRQVADAYSSFMRLFCCFRMQDYISHRILEVEKDRDKNVTVVGQYGDSYIF